VESFFFRHPYAKRCISRKRALCVRCIQVIILGLCIVCAYMIKEYKFYYLPESGAAILLGLIVGAWYASNYLEGLIVGLAESDLARA
jgi:hypothetical protein